MARRISTQGLALLLLGVANVAACGSKSGLLLGGGESVPAGSGGASSGGQSAGGGGGVVDAGPDAPPPLPDCLYVPHGEPRVLFSYVEGVHTPNLVRLDGNRFAVGLIHEHFWHPEIRVAEISVGPSWPDGVQVTHGMLLYGIDAHAPGQLVPATTGPSELALLYYHADEASAAVTPGVKLRRFDTTAWQPFDEVFVEKLGGYAYSLAPGPSLGKGMGWAGLGYGMTWRSATSGDASNYVVSTRVAVSDSAGNLVAGPVDVSAPSAYPGVGATVVWNGQHYLVARNDKPCDGAGPECAARLTLARFEPGVGAAAQLVDTGVVAPVPGRRARTPLLRSWAGATWVAWREQPIEAKPGDDSPSTLRLAAPSADGQVTQAAWQTEAHPDAGAELLASDQGLLLVWGERIDPTLPSHQVGHSRLVLRQLSKTGAELQELELPTSSLSSGTAYAVATLDEPRALLVAWTAQEAKPASHTQAYLARFDCMPQ